MGGNLIGSAAGSGIIDPLLDLLDDNGGPTETHALLVGSPALDAGDPLFSGPPDEDQRGVPFARIFGAAIDIGAYEAQTVDLIVNTTVDESDGDYSPGDLSLPEAIDLTNANAGADTITFDPTLFGVVQTIALGNQLPTIREELTITGPGQDLLTIDAGDGTDNTPGTGDGFRIFNINDGTGATIDVELIGLTLTGGDITGGSGNGGGAIKSRENLTLTGSTVSGNSTAGDFAYGGGIFSRGALTLTQSTVSGNNTTGLRAHGGGIYVKGALTVTGSSVSGNSIAGDDARGGGIHAEGDVTLTQSTLSGNSTMGYRAYGGGIYTRGAVTLTQSTVSGNSTAGIAAGLLPMAP